MHSGLQYRQTTPQLSSHFLSNIVKSSMQPTQCCHVFSWNLLTTETFIYNHASFIFFLSFHCKSQHDPYLFPVVVNIGQSLMGILNTPQTDKMGQEMHSTSPNSHVLLRVLKCFLVEFSFKAYTPKTQAVCCSGPATLFP